MTNDGINNVEKLFSKAGILKNNNFYDPENLHLVHHVNQALRANHLFEKGRDYIVKDGSLKIIDELTGRILEGRRFGDGLHQALEAKEKIQVQAENQTLASITYQWPGIVLFYLLLHQKLSKVFSLHQLNMNLFHPLLKNYDLSEPFALQKISYYLLSNQNLTHY